MAVVLPGEPVKGEAALATMAENKSFLGRFQEKNRLARKQAGDHSFLIFIAERYVVGRSYEEALKHAVFPVNGDVLRGSVAVLIFSPVILVGRFSFKLTGLISKGCRQIFSKFWYGE